MSLDVEENDNAMTLMDEMANRLAAPAMEEDPHVLCPIAWAGHDAKGDNHRGDYEPGKVCIGPFHKDIRRRRSAMEKKKKDVLDALLPRNDQATRRTELARYLGAMERIVPLARRYYNKNINWLNNDQFACMLLLDGCFLHSRFVRNHRDPEGQLDEDINVDRDVIFLLENQIPFFVIVEINRLLIVTTAATAAGTTTADVVVEEVINSSESFVLDKVVKRVEALVRRNQYSKITEPLVPSAISSTDSLPLPCHLLHLLYMYFRPTALKADNQDQRAVISVGQDPVRQVRWKTATAYYAAGVRFAKCDLGAGAGDMPRSILDVELTVGGTLRIPRLTMDSNTCRMLRNMVALEQTRPVMSLGQQRSSNHVTAYCLFLSQLAGTVEDVDLLVAKGIIVHFLNSNAHVAAGLAKLCDGIVIDGYDPDHSYLRCHLEALEKLCQDGWRKSMAWLRHIKCNNYLMALGVVAVIILFLCTVEQSVFAALSYVRSKD